MYTLEKVWPEWKVVKEIGRGSYGVVYKCVKEEKNRKKYAAIKVISVPRDEFEMEDVVSERMTQEQSKAYYKDIADDLLKEIEILKSLKGTKNIVEIYDAKVVEKEDGIGWNIFISMEMLTDFTTYASDKKFTQEDVIKLGTDLCSALSVCHKARIIHRDIKPENIFVDDFGNFKLGDFGVAKQMAKTKGSVSVKGTYGYMSPEVFSGKKCDGRADLYSLALVMYKLLNNNRFPFIDSGKQIVKYSERQQAFERRIKGESIPAIKGISNELNAVILKACSFRNVDRQKNIDEFRKQLESVGKGKKSGNKAKIAVAAVATAVVLVSVVTGVAHYKEYMQNQQGEIVDVIPEERSYTELSSLSGGLSEHNSIDGKYLIEGKGDDAGKYYLVSKDEVVGNLEEMYPGMKEGHKILAYNDKKLYYSVDGYGVYRYNCKNKESSVNPYIKSVNVDSIVYFNDKFVYFVESNNDPSGNEYKSLVKFNSKSGSTPIARVKDAFECDGYIIYSADDDSGYYCYDASAEYPVSIAISDNAVTDIGYYIENGKLYFVENDENENLVIRHFDLKTAQDKTDAIDTASGDGDTVTDDSTIEAEDNINIIAELDKVESIKSITGASWKIVGSFNDKYAVVCNENALEGEVKWYIWYYESNEFNPIEKADAIFVDGNYEIFVDNNLSEHIMIAVWEGHSYKICEIYPSGVIQPYNGHHEVFMEKKMDSCYRISDKYFFMNADGNMVSEIAVEGDISFVENEETLCTVRDNVYVYYAPTLNTLSVTKMRINEVVCKLGAINDKWYKVKVNVNGIDEIAYIQTFELGDWGITEADVEDLVKNVTEDANYNVKHYDHTISGNTCSLNIYATSKGEFPVEMNIHMVAALNSEKTLDVVSVEDDELPYYFNRLSEYIKSDRITGHFTDFSLYDINHDGVYELIAHKASGGKRHGVYCLTKSGNTYEKVNVNNGISAKEIQLYEIEEMGLICYYANASKEPDKNGVINLKVISIDDAKGVVESDLAYKGSAKNIKPLATFKVEHCDKVLGIAW